MRHQLQPEGHLVSAIVVSDPRLETDMQILLVFGAEFGPDDLFEAVRLGVDERGVLRNWEIWIPGREKKVFSYVRNYQSLPEYV